MARLRRVFWRNVVAIRKCQIKARRKNLVCLYLQIVYTGAIIYQRGRYAN